MPFELSFTTGKVVIVLTANTDIATEHFAVAINRSTTMRTYLPFKNVRLSSIKYVYRF